jgi:hypothetical protein
MNKGKKFSKSGERDGHGSSSDIRGISSTIQYRRNHAVGSSYLGNTLCPFYPIQAEEFF